MYRLALLPLVIACGGSPTRPPIESHAPATTSDPPPAAPISAKATSWIEKLSDPRESERALTELEQLGDPATIAGIGKYFVASREPRVLRVVIAIAKKSPASWPAAHPYLEAALDGGDSPREIDSAIVAADAIGEAKLSMLGPLAASAARPVTRAGIPARIAAIRAIGAIATDKPRSIAVLGKLIARPRPPTSDPAYALFFVVAGASINALAQLRDPAAIPILMPLPLEVPELLVQTRRALLASGRAAIPELRKMLRGTHPAINELIRRRKLDQACGTDPADCQKVAPAPYYAATLLADFHATEAGLDLVEELRRPPLPAYVYDDTPGPSQQIGIATALGRLGVPETASGLRAMWSDAAAELSTRMAAVDAYAFAARDPSGVAELGKIAFDNNADDGLRTKAAATYGRLARDPNLIAPLFVQANKYVAAAATRRAEAKKLKPAADAADKQLAAAAQALDAAKQNVLVKTRDVNATAADIKAAVATAKAAEDSFKAIKKTTKDKTSQYRSYERVARDYIGFARMFQNHGARIDLAVTCGTDPACYVATLRWSPLDAAKRFAKRLPDAANWSDVEREGLLEAYVDRAMIELGKLGDKAQPAVDGMLELIATDSVGIRMAILTALPNIVRRPCDKCVMALDRAIAAGEGKTELANLQAETQIVRNYFAP